MNADVVYATLARGSAADRIALLDQLPPDDMKGTVSALLASESPGMPIIAFGLLVMKYCYGQEPALGATLAQALHRYGVEVFVAGRDPSLQLFTLTGLAFNYVNASALLGRSDDVIAFTSEWIPFYEARGEQQNLPSLKAARAAALLSRNRIDEAEAQLRDPSIRGNVATDIEVVRLEKKLQELKARITATKAPAPAPAGAFGSEEAQRAIERALGAVLGGAATDKADASGTGSPAVSLADALRGLAGAKPTNPTDPEQFANLLETLRVGDSVLTAGTTGENQWTIKRRIREATGIFVRPGAATAAAIDASRHELEHCLTWAREHDDVEQANDALWGLYLCHGRRGNPSSAADALLGLRGNLEARRSGISNPLERGGVFADYPYLFDALCEKLHAAGRLDELLESIEAAKGRGIADILTQKMGRPVADADVYAAARNIRALAATHRFHYLAFHVDEERTYAVLVTSDGTLYSPEAILLGRQAIRDAALHADPRDWGQPLDEDPSIRIADTSHALAGLVAWLQPFLDSGRIAADDHLCYVADEDLANVPLHYLRFGTGVLADRLSISKIHGAFHLQLLLEGGTARRPGAFIGVVVPTKQNVAQSAWPAMKQAMWQPVEWLRARMGGDAIADASADLTRISSLDLRHRILHLSTHGIFAAARSPFEHSGVVLATNGLLPDERAVATGSDLGAVLTPSRVLDVGLDLQGSHVSLMACVSGLSREGRGGDALGLEWALMQAGASSVLASHWYVSARLAAEFFERFYEHWLQDKMSRARAHTQALRELRQAHGEKAAHAWAAFSLVGDWR